MSDLTSLLERVEKAEEPDSALDIAIACALLDARKHKAWSAANSQRPKGAPPLADDVFWMRHARHYTSSIDAALALVEEKLPGAEYQISTLYGIADVELPLNYAQSECIGRARREDGDVPLAVLSALLRALIAQKETADV